MATFREKPEKDCIYHIYNRGVEKRDIFINDADYWRFLSSLYFYNDASPSKNISRLCEVGLRTNNDERKKLVEILAFVLMPNHYHLLVKPLCESGATEFMRKIGTGYTNYFNIKHSRVGSLFQNKYKLVKIESDEQLSYIPFYIHMNPIGLIEPDWKERIISDQNRTFEYLEKYRWSSHNFYSGRKDFQQLIDRESLADYLGQPSEYRQDLLDWLREMDTAGFEELLLE